MIRFRSELTRATHFRVMLTLALTSPAGLALRAALVLAASAYVMLTFSRTCGGVRVATVFAAITAVVLIAFIPAVDALIAWMLTVSQRSRSLYVPIDVTADDEGLHLHSELTDGRVAWRAYVKWRRIGDVYLLYQTGRVFNAFDLSDLPAEDRARFEELLRRDVG